MGVWKYSTVHVLGWQSAQQSLPSSPCGILLGSNKFSPFITVCGPTFVLCPSCAVCYMKAYKAFISFVNAEKLIKHGSYNLIFWSWTSARTCSSMWKSFLSSGQSQCEVLVYLDVLVCLAVTRSPVDNAVYVLRVSVHSPTRMFKESEWQL